MLGKTVEIIAFELNEQTGEPPASNNSDKILRFKQIEDFTKTNWLIWVILRLTVRRQITMITNSKE